MLWLAARNFGEEGFHAKKQLQTTLAQAWSLGIESGAGATFASIYQDWADHVA
jgi:hypothetical protein